MWVLDTATKGTGAEMVPLERLQKERRRKRSKERISVTSRAKPDSRGEPSVEAEEPRTPRRFKVLHGLSRQVLAEDVGAAEAIDVLRGVRTSVDVNVYVWRPDEEDWRPLTLAEQRTLWDFREAPRDE